MSHFLCKTVHRCYGMRALLGQRQTTHKDVSFKRIRWFSISSEECQKHSLTVSYLMNSLGFSEDKALSASKHVSFETTEKPDKVIEFFEGQGLTRPQISSLVKAFPQVLSCDTHKTVLPKLEFLRAKGLSRPDMASLLSKFPCFIKSSLPDKIVPSYDFLRSVFGSDEKAILAVKKCPDVLRHSPEKYLSPKIDALRQHGVSVSNIFKLVQNFPRLLSRSSIEFKKVVEQVAELGFDASTAKFTQATAAMLIGMRESKWESKAEAYKKWGWSDKEVITAFKADPLCMLYSLDKISVVMEFFVNEMGLKPSQLAISPALLGHSLNKVKVRFNVYRALVSKGLLKKDVCLVKMVSCSEKKIVKRFVTCYVDKAPELLDLYESK